MAKIKKEVMSSKVYSSLKTMIADYRFRPGARVNVEKVARELGVSQQSVSSALAAAGWRALSGVEEGVARALEAYGVA